MNLDPGTKPRSVRPSPVSGFGSDPGREGSEQDGSEKDGSEGWPFGGVFSQDGFEAGRGTFMDHSVQEKFGTLLWERSCTARSL